MLFGAIGQNPLGGVGRTGYAVGQILTVSAALVAGGATVANDNTSDGSLGWWGIPRYVDWPRPRNAEAPGAELVIRASIIGGKAHAEPDIEMALLAVILDLDLAA